MARMMKQVAVIQWTKRSKALKRTILRPERPLLSITMPRAQVENDEQRQHAEDGDPADPAQRHVVKLLPVTANRVLEHVGPYVRNGATALNCLELLEQLLLFHRVGRRIDHGSAAGPKPEPTLRQ